MNDTDTPITTINSETEEKSLPAKRGRPSTCTPEMISKSLDYLQVYESAGDVIPSVVGLANYLGQVERQLYKWGDINHDFSQILETIKQTQHQVLLNKGLSSQFNSHICKLVLGKHGYHDRHEHTGKDGEPLQFLHSIKPTVGPPGTRTIEHDDDQG